MVLAGALLVGGAALFGLRGMQLASGEGDGSPGGAAAPADSAREQAIVIGVQRAPTGSGSAAAGAAPRA
jgi:hypothetical protein